MKTPYDTALRALQREVDDLRVSIGAAADRLMQVETLRQAMSDAIRAEAALAASDWTLSPEAYLILAHAERDRLAAERRQADARLEALRRQAMDSYGSLRAMEEAASVYRADTARAAATVEQAAVDDFASARFVRAMRDARRAVGH